MADELREGRLRRDYEKLDGRRPGQLLSDEMRAAGRRTMVAKSAERANELAPLIAELRAAGFRSRGAIADALTEPGIPTARGCAEWSETQVARLLTKLARSSSSASRAQVDSPPVGATWHPRCQNRASKYVPSHHHLGLAAARRLRPQRP
jgi:hypothetical protein